MVFLFCVTFFVKKGHFQSNSCGNPLLTICIHITITNNNYSQPYNSTESKKILYKLKCLLNILNCLITKTRSTTAMDPQNLKSKISQRVGYQSNKKNTVLDHSFKKSAWFINSFLQQILGSHELKSHGHFWPCPPKYN